MPDSLTAFGVFLLAVLPGGLYVWSFERVVGRWGIGLADRLLRLVAASAVFLAVFAAPLYLFWAELSERPGDTGHRSVAEFLGEGEAIPWWVYLCLLGYVSVPIVLGTLAGRAVRSRNSRWKRVGRLIGGRTPAPRAWEFVFSSSPAATVRLRLKEGGT